jgi:hypothetical protein
MIRTKDAELNFHRLFIIMEYIKSISMDYTSGNSHKADYFIEFFNELLTELIEDNKGKGITFHDHKTLEKMEYHKVGMCLSTFSDLFMHDVKRIEFKNYVMKTIDRIYRALKKRKIDYEDVEKLLNIFKDEVYLTIEKTILEYQVDDYEDMINEKKYKLEKELGEKKC